MTETIRTLLPAWMANWLDVIVPLVQIVLILMAAELLRSLVYRLLRRLTARASLPPEFQVAARRVPAFLIYAGALMLVLETLGVSSTTLWTAFTGFAAVGAVAFFAAWSVLSNIFCAFLIFSSRPFRLHDHIELLEGGDKPGLKGRVIDINLIYTTLEEVAGPAAGAMLRVPNALFFQRTVRRWPGSAMPQAWLPKPAEPDGTP